MNKYVYTKKMFTIMQQNFPFFVQFFTPYPPFFSSFLPAVFLPFPSEKREGHYRLMISSFRSAQNGCAESKLSL